MSFSQIHNEGVMARTMGRAQRENPYYESENLPTSESAAVYRAWQMKAEAWEQGWRDQDEILNAAARCAPQPSISIDRRAIPLTARVQRPARVKEGERLRKSAGGVAA
jgi:hypothetical protein